MSLTCDDCGCFAANDRAAEKLRSLPDKSPALLNVFAYTREHSSASGPLVLWKLRDRALQIDDPAFANPKTWLVRDVEDELEQPVRHAEKPNDLLRLIAGKLSGKGPFEGANLSLMDLRLLQIADWMEARTWLHVLTSRFLVNADALDRWIGTGSRSPDVPPVFLSPQGWSEVEKLFGNVASTSCFIAMSFGLANRGEVQGAIEAACTANGWKGTPVDAQEYTGSIMDQVLALINRAKFVVADFTEHRSGVYYEAGYAEGRGIPVIYTVRKSDANNRHFDTRHINHIEWETPNELRERLTARIGAVINR